MVYVPIVVWESTLLLFYSHDTPKLIFLLTTEKEEGGVTHISFDVCSDHRRKVIGSKTKDPSKRGRYRSLNPLVY